MIRKFNFDYDYENDDLFMYDPDSKSKMSVELDDFIIDYNSKKELSAIELLNASEFFKGLEVDGAKIDKKLLKCLQGCKIEIIPKNKFLMLKLILVFKANKVLTAPVYIPALNKMVRC